MAEESNLKNDGPVIDMTLSDEEEPTHNTEQESLKKMVISTEAEANDPTSFETPSSPGKASGSSSNLILGSLLEDCPSADELISQLGPPDGPKASNLLEILGNYTPFELARVTTRALIECIARFPALWDSRESSFDNHKYCSLLWKNIAAVLNMPVKRVKQKWRELKKAFRKEYFKSKETGNPSRFVYYDALTFLEEEMQRENELANNLRSKYLNIPTQTNSTPNNLSNSGADLEDDDCMIVEDVEDSLQNSTTIIPPKFPSTKSTVNSEDDDKKPDGTKFKPNLTAQSINGTAHVENQTMPAFVIRPKNISELMPLPSPPPLKTAVHSSAPSPPEIVFLSEKPRSISRKRKIVVSDAFAPSFDKREENPSSSSNPQETNVVDERRSPSQKAIRNQPPKKVKPNSKTVNGELPKILDVVSIAAREPNGTPSGKRLSETVPSNSKLIKKTSLPSSESLHRSRDVQLFSEVNRGFLMSLLPDVEGMTNAQFRTFKKQATALVSMILDR